MIALLIENWGVAAVFLLWIIAVTLTLAFFCGADIGDEDDEYWYYDDPPYQGVTESIAQTALPSDGDADTPVAEERV